MLPLKILLHREEHIRMKVCEIMSNAVVSVGPDEPVAAAARLLKRWNLGALPVCDPGGHLRGFVTDRDIVLRCVAAGDDPAGVPVREVMSRAVSTADPNENVSDLIARMGREQLRRLPVTDSGRVIGMVTLCDLARRTDCSTEAAAALHDISLNIRRAH